MVEAVIFDMDGLMVNSEPIRSRAFEAMIKRFGGRPRRNQYGVVQTIGVNVSTNCRNMQTEYKLDGSLEELVAEHEAVYTHLFADRIVPMPGLLRLVAELGECGVMMAVASSSSRQQIDMVVNKLWQVVPFETIVSGTEVKRGKPAPDIFLKAAKKLRVTACQCVVLEDAESGIQGAKAAGMRTIAVPTRFTQDHDFTDADLVVSSLEHVDRQLLSAIL